MLYQWIFELIYAVMIVLPCMYSWSILSQSGGLCDSNSVLIVACRRFGLQISRIHRPAPLVLSTPIWQSLSQMSWFTKIGSQARIKQGITSGKVPSCSTLRSTFVLLRLDLCCLSSQRCRLQLCDGSRMVVHAVWVYRWIWCHYRSSWPVHWSAGALLPPSRPGNQQWLYSQPARIIHFWQL